MPLELDMRPLSANPEVAIFERLARRLAELERRVAELDRQRFAVPVNAGAPLSGDGATGSLAGDSTNNRLWVKIGGTWKYTALT